MMEAEAVKEAKKEKEGEPSVPKEEGYNSQWPIEDMLCSEEGYLLKTYYSTTEYWKLFFTQHKEDQRTEVSLFPFLENFV